MKILGIEHIGIAVKSLEDSIAFYESVLGLKCYAIENVVDQHVRTAFFKIGDIKIELLESTNSDGPISSFINKRGEGLHHIAYKVESVSMALNELKGSGVKLIDQSERIGAEGLLIAFLNPKSTYGALTELCSSNDKINEI
jgi:methylmalonyl-CoA/ethylmalonyl-CoA epimerase